ncbi:MAG TPA: DAHL domain-containing protein [Polyangiaceae bacterium]|nr:DAHL domain-containing protein [Polyangiaceae bacterium]
MATLLAVASVLVERHSPDQLQHQAFIRLLAERRELHAKLIRDTLEARFQFSANYDRLAQDDAEMRRLQIDSASSLPSFLRPTDRNELAQALTRSAAAIRERQRLLEHFKSSNALLKNSTSYFPGLAAGVRRQVEDPELARSIDELRALTLALALRDDANVSEAQRAQLELAASLARGRIAPGQQRNFELLLAHASTIGSAKRQTDDILSQILKLPVPRAEDAIERAYQTFYARAQRESHLFTHFLSGLALLLLGMVAYTGLQLRRAAVALRRSHDGLEVAVAARTVELEQSIAHSAHVEVELRQAQKLEAVGQLASGIAHELNTPIQYVGDNLYFLRETFGDVLRVLERYRAAGAERAHSAREESLSLAKRLEDDLDLPALLADVPAAFERTLQGTSEVVAIVRAMKVFAHRSLEKTPTDLNAALENALLVCRNEYKYVANLVKELHELPLVTCDATAIRHVFLNLIVNAGHAISEVVGDSGERGQITVRTERFGDSVRVSVTDTGAGIAEAVRGRIFDPFFTTKSPGKGSGQGLAISHRLVTQHGGKLWFETELGKGSTFHVDLPLGTLRRVSSDLVAESRLGVPSIPFAQSPAIRHEH